MMWKAVIALIAIVSLAAGLPPPEVMALQVDTTPDRAYYNYTVYSGSFGDRPLGLLQYPVEGWFQLGDSRLNYTVNIDEQVQWADLPFVDFNKPSLFNFTLDYISATPVFSKQYWGDTEYLQVNSRRDAFWVCNHTVTGQYYVAHSEIDDPSNYFFFGDPCDRIDGLRVTDLMVNS
ncbi:hypothetical protein TRVA0_010S03246 [Trichomonascus vanleenenianus]|uniref:uncharacterized protein n=1 Tax=Trichomonascus vanleenenianus TaxID=2268995 RepID=UPI003ECA8F16